MEDIIAEKGRKWHGYYEKFGQKGFMQFDKFFIEGSIVKGKGTDMIGDFEINGTID